MRSRQELPIYLKYHIGVRIHFRVFRPHHSQGSEKINEITPTLDEEHILFATIEMHSHVHCKDLPKEMFVYWRLSVDVASF